MADKLPPGAVRLFSILNASDQNNVAADDGLIVAWDQSYLTALISVLGISTTLPTPSRLWTGGTTDTGFKVNFDVVATNLAAIATASFIVSPNANMSSPVFTATPVAPTATTGRTASYRTAAFTVTGLTPDTLYYYVPVVNGAAVNSFKGTVRTAPTAGTAKSFNFIWASCTNSAYTLPNVYATVPGLAASFIMHGGDMRYLDPQIADIGLMRDGLSRSWRSATGVQAMLLTAPIVLLRDDHETWNNNGAWNMVSSAGYTFQQVAVYSLQEYAETTPSYPIWDAKVIGQSFTWGRTRFIVPDLRHQGVHPGYGLDVTFMGTGTSPPSSYDQLTKVLDEIAAASADPDIALVFFVSSRTWSPAVGDSWDMFNPAEQTIIANALQACTKQVYLLVGDAHQMVIDDGTYNDRSGTRTSKVPMVLSSGWFMQNLLNNVTQATWNGDSGLITGPGYENATAYTNIKVIDSGIGTPIVEVEYWGGPISGTTATLLTSRTYRSDDAVPVVEMSSSSTLYIPNGEDGEIEVDKDWFGGCSVTGTFTSGRPVVDVAFTPNTSRFTIPYPYIAGAADQITLSAPVGCTLGSNTVRAIDYYTLEAETIAYLAAMDTQPTTAQVFAINALIAGLISDGVWVDLLKTWWLGAPTEQASLLNMITPADALPVATNGPVFAPLRGWRGNGVTGTEPEVAYLDTGYAIPGGMQNDVSMFVYTLDAMRGVGDMGGGNFYISSSWTVGDEMRFRASATTTDSVTSPTGTAVAGCIGWTRNASGTYVPYYNGVAQTAVTRTSATPGGSSLWLAGYKNTITPTAQQSSPRTNAFGIVANGLDPTQTLALYNRLRTFLQAIGTIP